MKHRKMFVCLTALLLVSVFAVNALAAADMVPVPGYGKYRINTYQQEDFPRFLVTVSSVTKNESNARFQVSGYTSNGKTGEERVQDEMRYYLSERGVTRFEQLFPLYFSIDYYPVDVYTNHFFLDENDNCLGAFLLVKTDVSVP